MNNNRSDFNILKESIIRFVLICIGFGIIALIPMADILVFHDQITEISATEICQEAFLFICSVLFYILAAKRPNHRGAFILIAGFFLCMLIRELDGLFDMIVHGFWKYPAWLVSALSLAYAYFRGRGSVLTGLTAFCQTKQCNTLCYGLAIVLVFSRLFGMGLLWHGAMGDGFMHIVKNMAEEIIELEGYGFLLSASISYFVYCLHDETHPIELK